MENHQLLQVNQLQIAIFWRAMLIIYRILPLGKLLGIRFSSIPFYPEKLGGVRYTVYTYLYFYPIYDYFTLRLLWTSFWDITIFGTYVIIYNYIYDYKFYIYLIIYIITFIYIIIYYILYIYIVIPILSPWNQPNNERIDVVPRWPLRPCRRLRDLWDHRGNLVAAGQRRPTDDWRTKNGIMLEYYGI